MYLYKRETFSFFTNKKEIKKEIKKSDSFVNTLKMSGPSQTVNFLPPSYITTLTTTVTSMSGSIASIQAQTTSLSGSVASLNSSVTSMSGSVSVLTTRSTVLTSTGSFTALANCTYQYLLPIRWSGSLTVSCTLPASPADGDFVELVDSSDILQGWGNTSYSCRVLAQGTSIIKGDCAYYYPNAFGDLFNYRGMTVRFVYNASLNAWLGSAKGNSISKPDEPYSGWWERITRAAVQGGTNGSTKSNYVKIDATRYPILFEEYEGNSKETLMKQVSTPALTFFEATGASSSNPYGKVLARISTSYPFYYTSTGPTLTFTSSTPYFIYFVGASYDYIGINAATPITSKSYGKNTYAVSVFRRINISQNKSRDEPIDFNAIDNVGGEFLNDSLYDPVFMFKKLMKQGENMQCAMNSNFNSYSVNDYYIRKQYINDILSAQGVTFSVPIELVRKSHVFTGANLYPSTNPAYTGGSTMLTDICCAFSQYCAPGSNVTLSGFSGSWAGMNGYYPNGVSAFSWQTNKENAGRMDFLYGNALTYTSLRAERVFTGSATGTALSWVNRFMLLKDTSDPSYLAETTGAYKGYAAKPTIGDTPTASVVHRVYSGMPLNEWIAVCQATIKYLFNHGVHMAWNAYFNTVQGQIPSDWTQLSSSNTFSQRIRPKGGEFSGQTPLLRSFYSAYYNDGRQVTSLNRLNSAINDPYQATDFINNYVLGPGAQTLTDNTVIPLLNYCETGTVKNLYFAYAGGAPTTPVQRFYATSRNLDNPSITGGTTIVGGLFPWRLANTTGAYPTIYTNPAAPTGTIWNLAGSSTNDFIIGKVRSELVGGKTVMYIRMSSYGTWVTAAGAQYSDFTPSNYTGPSDLSSNPWFGSYGANEQVFSVIGKYMNSFSGATGAPGPDGIILDQRANGGGGTARELVMCFGADRYVPIRDTNLIDDGYTPAFLGQKFATGANAYWTPKDGASGRTYWTPDDTDFKFYQYYQKVRPSQMELNFGPNTPYIVDGISRTGANSVVKNCNIVVLGDEAAGSAAENFPLLFFGDNGDKNLGNGVRANIIGERTNGSFGFQPGATEITRPKNSLRFNLSTFPSYAFDSSSTFFSANPSGPTRGKGDGYEDPTFNTNNAPTGPNPLVGTSGQVGLPNDFSLPVYDLGLLAPPSGTYYISQSRPLPSTSDPRSWRDIWFEQSLKQAQYM